MYSCDPAEIIYYLLSPIALAFWIIDDGYKHGSGLVICTDCFTIDEVIRLINVLMIRYRLNCTLHTENRGNKQYHRIYIRAKSMPLLRSIVIPNMAPSILYKLGI
jgi:ubiquinol-cytochrome c reductase cytochrome b subunit